MFRAHAAPQGVCDYLINALKFLANYQKYGDSPVKMVVEGFQEKSRQQIMDGLRRFIMVDNREAVKVGDSEKNMESRPVAKPKFTTDFPEALVQEGADELTLRPEEEGMLRTFIDTTEVGDSRWGPPLVDEDWHAICQAIFQGVEGSGWEIVCHNCKELHKAVKCKKSRENKKARALWSLKDAKRQRNRFLRSWQCAEDYTRSQVRLDLWAIHLKSPTAALADALRRTEDGAAMAQSSAAGGAKREHPSERVFEFRSFLSV